MIDSIPEIDKRDSSKILDEISNLIPYYVPKWNPSYNKDDLAVGLSKAYANLLDNVIYKLNQVPQRNFIEFLNVLGVTLTSKQAAKVPVTMTLTKGIEKNILVPKQTEVVAKATSAHDELTFITDSDLLVTFSDLVKICSVEKDMNGLDTKIYDHTDNMLKREPFSFFTGENLQEHVLYISHNDLFNLETREITISFQSNESKSSKDNEQLTSIFSNPALIRWEYNWEIDKTTGKEIPDSAKQMRFYNTQENSILLEKNPTKIKEIIVHGIKSRWIRCRLKPQNIDSPNFVTSNANLRRDFLNAMNCPKISKLEISIPPPSKNLGSKSFYDQLEKPEMIFSGETPLQKNSFYPFGKNVNISNIFYVSSPLFSKKGLSIEILLDYSSELLSSENNNSDDNEGDIDKSYLHYNKIDILWEFWNGNGWVLLDSIRSDRFPRGWILGLKCPDTIKPSSVNGHENYWIRGRIDPSYFTNKTKVVQKDNIFEIDYGFGDLPKITGINVSISEQSSDYGYAPQHCIAYNNLEYENCIDASNSSLKIKPFRAFKTYEIDSPSVFFGFDKKIEGGPINIFISSLKKNYLTNLENQDNFVSNLNYYCSSKNNSWEKISSSDNTYGFSKTGTIQIIFPSKFTNSKIFSDDLYWVMAKDESQKYTINKTQGNLINGILLNTVEVLHGTKIVELLGTSDYSLNQKFKLTNSPISENKIKLLVNEFGFVKDNEKEFLLSQKKIYKDSATLPDELWVEWDEVQDLYSTDSNDRKFVLDRESKIIEFGDGIQGKIPPAVRDNIKIEYLTGGGKEGNIKANEIASLKGSIPFIEKVFNPLDAGNGGDTESINSATNRGPQIIKNRGQAVTAEDYEWIIKEKFPSVSKVKCLSNTDYRGSFKPGYITITMVESSASSIPIPSSKSLAEIGNYLKKISNSVISENISVVSPTFAHVSVSAIIYPYDINDATEAKNTAVKKITQFLDPLRGGFYNDGWNFGQLVSVSDVYALLESLPLVDHVDKILLSIQIESDSKKNYTITTDDDIESIHADSKTLVCNGDHSISVKWEQY